MFFVCFLFPPGPSKDPSTCQKAVLQCMVDFSWNGSGWVDLVSISRALPAEAVQ